MKNVIKTAAALLLAAIACLIGNMNSVSAENDDIAYTAEDVVMQ